MDHSLSLTVALTAFLPTVAAESGLKMWYGHGFWPSVRLELAFYDATHAFNATTRQRMVDTFLTVYPKLVDTYNAKASKKVTFIVDALHEGVASTVGDVIVFNADYLAKNPGNIDVVTHEVRNCSVQNMLEACPVP